MSVTYVEPPKQVRIPIAWAMYVEKLLREARVKSAWTLGSDERIHVAFETKGRVFSMGIAQLMTGKDGVTLSVLNIHVGPWSKKDTVAMALERAGAHVETDDSFKNDLTVSLVDDGEIKFITIPLRR